MSRIETAKAALPFLVAVRQAIKAPPESNDERWFAARSAQYMALAICTIRLDGKHNARYLMGGSSSELIKPCCQSLVNGTDSLNDDLLQMYLVAIIAHIDGDQIDWLSSVANNRVISLSATLLRKTLHEHASSRGAIPPGYPDEAASFNAIIAMWDKVLSQAALSAHDRYRSLVKEALDTHVISLLGHWSLNPSADDCILGVSRYHCAQSCRVSLTVA